MKLKPEKQTSLTTLESVCKSYGLSVVKTDQTIEFYDEDGDWLFSTTVAILPYDLQQMLKYADKEYRRGEIYGREKIQKELKTLLDV